ncbi:hypothetical protein [Halobellus rufus]|uniref:hypothetical protein n=1 Tax=Halobellus rufus TaxID=1448860 RepID=UPI000678AA21|nr:hypothetical protein [Halobellus rufus]
MAQAPDTGRDVAGEYLYHVVCHDCPTESLSEDATEAEAQGDEHRTSTGHHVEVAELLNE